MPKAKKIVKASEPEVVSENLLVNAITPLEFADLNTVKDKINEIIARLNS